MTEITEHLETYNLNKLFEECKEILPCTKEDADIYDYELGESHIDITSFHEDYIKEKEGIYHFHYEHLFLIGNGIKANEELKSKGHGGLPYFSIELQVYFTGDMKRGKPHGYILSKEIKLVN